MYVLLLIDLGFYGLISFLVEDAIFFCILNLNDDYQEGL